MYINAKMIPVETISGIREWKMKDSSGRVNSSMIYLTNCKNPCKYYSLPPPSQLEPRRFLPLWVDSTCYLDFLKKGIHIPGNFRFKVASLWPLRDSESGTHCFASQVFL
jgi:hypothetical protein